VILIIVFICPSKKGPVGLASIVAENDFHVQYHLPYFPVNCFISARPFAGLSFHLKVGIQSRW